METDEEYEKLKKAHEGIERHIYEMSKVLHKQLRYVNNLSERLRDTITWYTLPDYYFEFNQKLREGERLSQEESRRFSDLEEMFAGVPPLETPLVVYKGVKKGEVVSDEAYSSTSLSRELARSFAKTSCCVLDITVSPGSRVLPLFDISEIRSEYEVLLERGGTWTVTAEGVLPPRDKFEEPMTLLKVSYIPPNSVEVTGAEFVGAEAGAARADESPKERVKGVEFLEEVIPEEELEIYDTREELKEALQGAIAEYNVVVSPEELDEVATRLWSKAEES